MVVRNTGSVNITIPCTCLKFGNDGVKDSVAIDGHDELYIPSGSKLSIACWYKHNNKTVNPAGSWANLVGKYNAYNWGLCIDTMTPFEIGFHGNTAYGYSVAGYGTTQADVISGSWVHYCGVYNGGDKVGGNKSGSLYVNGDLCATVFMKSGIAEENLGTQIDLYLGAPTSPSIGNSISGCLYDIRIWSGAALSAEEVRRVYNGLIVQPNYLVLNLKCDEREGTKVLDYSNYENTGNINGTDWDNRTIPCWCSVWNEGNWDISLEFIMDPCDRNFIYPRVTPGAVRELYNILGTPTFIDTTYSSSNTLIIEPIYGYGVSSLTEHRIFGVKNISDAFLNNEYFIVKMDGYRLDTDD